MLSIFFLHIIISFCCLAAGFLVYHLLLFRSFSPNTSRSAFFYLISGLVFLILVAQLISLFTPLTLFVQLVTLFAVILLLWVKKGAFTNFLLEILQKISSMPAMALVAATAVWILILIMNAGPIHMDDTESYHIQTVKWIKEFGTVPGLVHLHERYGFNSSWFTGISLFSFKLDHYNFYTTLNGVLSLWMIFYFISRINVSGNEERKALVAAFMFLAVFFLAVWPLLRANAATSNYDYIGLIIILVLFTETLLSKEIPLAEWIIWPVFLCTVRITHFPFLLLALYAFIQVLRKNQVMALRLFSFGLVLVLPFLARNLILSGYLFYPSLTPDLFSFDWKADPEKTRQLLHFIRHFNRTNTGFQDLSVTESLHFPQWIAPWFRFMFTYDKLIMIPGVIGWVIYPFVRKKISFLNKKAVKVFAIIISLQILTWFIIAPDPRFIYGPLCTGLLILLLYVFYLLKNINFSRVITHYFWAIFLGTSVFCVIKWNKDVSPGWMYPWKLPAPGLQEVKLNNTSLFIPGKIEGNWNPRCYDSPLPCLYNIDHRLEMRGPTLSYGFRLRKD